MPQTKVLTEAFSASPSARIDLWKLDGTAIGWDTIYYFVNGSSCNYQPIVFAGRSYTPFPIFAEGIDADGKGQLSRPRLTVSNINGFVSTLIQTNGPLDGATVTRTRVYARFIDAVNFPANQPLPSWVTPDPTATFAPESWQILRRMKQDNQVVTFELATSIEVQGSQLPGNQIIANLCRNIYRDPLTCAYSGPPVADMANRSFTSYYGMTLTNKGAYSDSTTYNRGDYVTTYSTLPQFANVPFVWVCAVNGTVGIAPNASGGNWIADASSRTIASCKLRFPNVPLRTSAYPGATRAGWIARA